MTSTSNNEFFEAIEDGDIESVRRLLDATPALLHEKNEHGLTPLMCAVSSMDRTSQLVQVLIEAGANVNAKTDEGSTALHWMVDVNGPTGSGEMPGQIARLLVDAGADIEALQHWGWTPLMQAALQGTSDELQALVDVGGDVNKSFPTDSMPECFAGCTTLAVTLGRPAKLRILIDAGVNLSATDAYGQTVLEHARECLAEDADDGEDGEAAEDGDDDIEITQEMNDALMAMSLKERQAAGVDLDAPLDASGITTRQSIEAKFRALFAEATEYDYAAEVRESISLIEKALGG